MTKNEYTKGHIPWNKGKKMCEAYCKKISEAAKNRKPRTGEAVQRKDYRGGLNKQGFLYKTWRKKVLERDGYKCQFCGNEKNLIAHHLIDYKRDDGQFIVKLMINVDNGQTLCRSCHTSHHQKDGGYNKGKLPWNVGKEHSKETREKISEKAKGRVTHNKGLKGVRNPVTGKVSYKQLNKEN